MFDLLKKMQIGIQLNEYPNKQIFYALDAATKETLAQNKNIKSTIVNRMTQLNNDDYKLFCQKLTNSKSDFIAPVDILNTYKLDNIMAAFDDKNLELIFEDKEFKGSIIEEFPKWSLEKIKKLKKTLKANKEQLINKNLTFSNNIINTINTNDDDEIDIY